MLAGRTVLYSKCMCATEIALRPALAVGLSAPFTFFIREKAKGFLRKDADEERLADFCIATLQGAMLVGKIRRNKRPVEMAFRDALEHLKYYATAPRQ